MNEYSFIFSGLLWWLRETLASSVADGGAMRTLEKSNKHFQKAVKKMPLGVSSNFRYWGDEETIST